MRNKIRKLWYWVESCAMDDDNAEKKYESKKERKLFSCFHFVFEATWHENSTTSGSHTGHTAKAKKSRELPALPRKKSTICWLKSNSWGLFVFYFVRSPQRKSSKSNKMSNIFQFYLHLLLRLTVIGDHRDNVGICHFLFSLPRGPQCSVFGELLLSGNDLSLFSLVFMTFQVKYCLNVYSWLPPHVSARKKLHWLGYQDRR